METVTYFIDVEITLEKGKEDSESLGRKVRLIMDKYREKMGASVTRTSVRVYKPRQP